MIDPTVVQDFDELRLYDKAIQDHFSGITLDSKEVPLVIGTVERAFATTSKLYGTDSKRIPLPVGNMLRAGWVRANHRFMGMGKMTSKIPVAGKSLKTQRPYPIDITYTLQYRVQTTSQSNILQKKLALATPHEKFIVSVNIPGFAQHFNFFATATALVNSFESNVGENADKIHVLSFAIVYETYFFHDFSLHTYSDEIETTWTVVSE